MKLSRSKAVSHSIILSLVKEDISGKSELATSKIELSGRFTYLDLIQNAAGLFQQELDVGAVLAHDVGKVATGVVQPVPLEVHPQTKFY